MQINKYLFVEAGVLETPLKSLEEWNGSNKNKTNEARIKQTCDIYFKIR